MKTGFKFRCYPDKNQQQLIHQTTGNARFIYNYFLKDRSAWWQDNKDLPKEQRSKPLSSFDGIKLLPKLKKEIYSLDKAKVKIYEEKLNKAIDFMTISGSDFETLKSYWLKDSLSTALQQTLLDLDGAFKDFFKKKKGYPQIKKKSSSGSFTLTSNNWRFYYKDNVKIHDKNLVQFQQLSVKKSSKNKTSSEDNDYLNYKDLKLTFSNTEFYLACCDKPLKIAFDKRIEQDIDLNKISQLTISYNALGEYFISFLINEDVKDFKSKNFIKNQDNYLKSCDSDGNHLPMTTSIDVGIKNSLNILTTTYQANHQSIVSQTFLTKKLQGFKRHDKKLRRAQKNLSRKKKGSRNYHKQCQKIARVHQDLVNYRNDFYHKASTEIVLNSDKIIVEDLNISGMMKNKRLSKSIHQQAWGTFFTMLKYKCNWYGKELIEVNRFFPSSKLCSHCHAYNSHVKQQDTWTCTNCGTKHQRDENSVVNLTDYEDFEKTNQQYIYKGNNTQPKIKIIKLCDDSQVKRQKPSYKRRYHSLNNGLLNNNFLNSNKEIPILLSRQEDECPSQACGETVRLESNTAIQQVSMKQEV